jgi:divalent metal cation (Fe/Co/Zn/Cd) transporter
MTMASIEVIQYSAQDLFDGFHGDIPTLDMTPLVYSLIAVGIAVKGVLYFYCAFAQKVLKSDNLGALAEDHFNDVISNSVAIVTACISSVSSAWWIDPIGAIIISLIIIW